jgi:catechol 1,2-dioxygenase
MRHLLQAIDEIGLTESELSRVCVFFDEVSASGEWRFLTHVFGVEAVAVENSHGGSERGITDNVEGPLYREGAPLVASPALLMREDEAGERILLSGTVRDQGGAAISGAVLDIWQSNAVGVYAEDDPEQPDWNFRRRVAAGDDGRFQVETVVPGCYEIGGASGMVCARLMKLLGRHCMRPGHIHLKLIAPGMQPMTAMLYFRGDPWLESDSIFSVRENIIIDLKKDRGPIPIASFDFELASERAREPA